jgi:hypothetical protein
MLVRRIRLPPNSKSTNSTGWRKFLVQEASPAMYCDLNVIAMTENVRTSFRRGMMAAANRGIKAFWFDAAPGCFTHLVHEGRMAVMKKEETYGQRGKGGAIRW